MARSLKQLEARLRALEEWRELMDVERATETHVVGFHVDHEYEDPEVPETWIDRKGKKQ